MNEENGKLGKNKTKEEEDHETTIQRAIRFHFPLN